MEQGSVLTIIKQLTALTKTKNQASQITEGKHKLTKPVDHMKCLRSNQASMNHFQQKSQ
jgi:hypothetical protein